MKRSSLLAPTDRTPPSLPTAEGFKPALLKSVGTPGTHVKGHHIFTPYVSNLCGAYLLQGQKSVDLPLQVVYGEDLAHLPHLGEDEESGVYVYLSGGEAKAQLESLRFLISKPLAVEESGTGERGAAGKPTRREKGAFLSNRSAVFWYLRISIRAFVPGRNLLLRADAACSGKAEMVKRSPIKTFFHFSHQRSTSLPTEGTQTCRGLSDWLLRTKGAFWSF